MSATKLAFFKSQSELTTHFEFQVELFQIFGYESNSSKTVEMPIDDDSPKNLKRKRSADQQEGNETKAKIIVKNKSQGKKVTTVKIK